MICKEWKKAKIQNQERSLDLMNITTDSVYIFIRITKRNKFISPDYS